MQSNLQHLPSPASQTLNDSLDWRFLLPLADAQAIRVLSDTNVDFNNALAQVGIPVAAQLSALNPKQGQRKSDQSLVFPFGLPFRWVDSSFASQLEFYRSLRHLMDAGGSLLIGFNNIWNVRGSTSAQYHASTPRRTVSQLKQAGFNSIKLFGAIPDLKIPEYIFDIESRAIHFALHHRYRRKPVFLSALRTVARTVGLVHISNFLPCYFAVATV